LKNLSGFWEDKNCGTRNPFICEKLKSGGADPNAFVQPLSFGDGKPCSDGYSTFGGIIIFSSPNKIGPIFYELFQSNNDWWYRH
jgi:hypothetical protein